MAIGLKSSARRNLLVALITSSILAACGGGNSTSSNTSLPPSAVTQAADKAVKQGLVGAVFGYLNLVQNPIGVSGVRTLRGKDMLRGDEFFSIGSNTKAMTAVVAARLIERGVISWDTKAQDVLPELKSSMSSSYLNVTLEQLLAHRGGILAFTDEDDFQRFQAFLASYNGELPSTETSRRRFFVNWLLSQSPPSNITPGTDFFYSNAGYILVAAMLEAATGKPFKTLFSEEVEQPLGIAGIWIPPNEATATGPNGYEGMKGQLALVQPLPAELQTWFAELAPSGLYATTPQNYSSWLRWHLLALRGQETPLPRGYVQRLKGLTPGSYAVGWGGGAAMNGRTVLVHMGHISGFSAEATVDVNGESASFALTNTGDGGNWVLSILNQGLLDIDLQFHPL